MERIETGAEGRGVERIETGAEDGENRDWS